MGNILEPKFTLLNQYGAIEMREYFKKTSANILVTGDRKEALKKGFKILFDYIAGYNKTQKKISMTAPVIQQSSEKISMTAPVKQIKVNDQWQVTFIMPTDTALADLPKPLNPDIFFQEEPAIKMIALRFKGWNTTQNINKHLNKLNDFIKQNNLNVQGAAEVAFYNPPWTLPFFRRNEILYQLIE